MLQLVILDQGEIIIKLLTSFKYNNVEVPDDVFAKFR